MSPATWAREGRTVLHVPTSTIGRVARAYGPGEYVSPANGRPVAGEVVELDSGASLVYDPEAFRELGPAEIALAVTAAQALSVAMRQLMGFAAAKRADPETSLDLLRAVLLAQARLLGETEPATDPRGSVAR